MDQLKNLEDNLKRLNQSFQSQCEEDWNASWEQLQIVWSRLEPLIQLVDKQPQIQQILGQNREILPNIVLQNVGTTSNDIMIAKPQNMKKTKITKKTKNLWTPDEIVKLQEALEIYNKKDFKNISNYIGTRTIAQVRSKMQKLEKKNCNQVINK